VSAESPDAARWCPVGDPQTGTWSVRYFILWWTSMVDLREDWSVCGLKG
jgi:hypothetical protein